MIRRLYIIATIWLMLTCDLYAGWLITPSAHWGVFSFRPKVYEPTPNYFGIGPGLTVGYSIHQIFDIAAFAEYIPGTYARARLGKEEASLGLIGTQFGIRSETIYFGLCAGRGYYRLVKESETDHLIKGERQGYAGGFILGTIFKTRKKGSLFLGFKLMTGQSQRIHPSALDATGENFRAFDVFSLSLSYSYNGYYNQSIKTNILRSIL